MFFSIKESEPIFINEVFDFFEAMDKRETTEIILNLIMDTAGASRLLRFSVPARQFIHTEIVTRYILARINNLLVTFGGVCLEIYFDTKNTAVKLFIEASIAHFDIGNPLNNRKGLGLIINYINRMNHLLCTENFQVKYLDLSAFEGAACEGERKCFMQPDVSGEGEKLLASAALNLDGKVFCGIDVGGTAIKTALVAENEILLLKTYSWFPASYATSEELIDPILLQIRLMSAAYRYIHKYNTNILPQRELFADDSASYNALARYAQELEAAVGGDEAVFDGIVIGFPDTVIDDKIAGGESYKQRGIRMNPNLDYAEEFKKQSDLNVYAARFSKSDGVVKVIIDSNVSSFAFSVEQAFAQESIIEPEGMLIFTIGTEMGTCLVSRSGIIQRIPLECYNYIIDLGTENAYRYNSNDVRSINNFNSGIPGTVQKYVSQNGLFRIALKHLQQNNVTLYESFFARGYLYHNQADDSIYITSSPKDMRGPFTRELVRLLKEGDADLVKTFEEIGEAIGVVIQEGKLLLDEVSTTKLVCGGIVVEDVCFQTIKNGLRCKYPQFDIKRMDTCVLHSPLLKKLPKQYANYVTAVGGVYLASRELMKKQKGACDV